MLQIRPVSDLRNKFPDIESYDAEGRIGNPSGLMADLNNQHEGFATVIIKPDM